MFKMLCPLRALAIKTLYGFFFLVICELFILGKDSGVDSRCFLPCFGLQRFPALRLVVTQVYREQSTLLFNLCFIIAISNKTEISNDRYNYGI